MKWRAYNVHALFQGWTHKNHYSSLLKPMLSRTKLKWKSFGIFFFNCLGLVISVALLLGFFDCFNLGPQKLGNTDKHCCSFFTWHFSMVRTNFPRKEGKIMGLCLGHQRSPIRPSLYNWSMVYYCWLVLPVCILVTYIHSFQLVRPVPLAHVLPHPQLTFPSKTWFFGVYLGFHHQKSIKNQYLLNPNLTE
jgi:hypothetical protein